MTAARLILSILAIIFVIELPVHYVVDQLLPRREIINETSANLINASLLALLSAPFIRRLVKDRLHQEAIRISEQWPLALVENAPDAIIITDSGGLIRQANARAQDIFGYGRNELNGMPVEVLMPEHSRAIHVKHRQAFNDAPHTRTMGMGLDLAARRKDGTLFPVEISLSPVQFAGQTLVLAAVRDVTERKRIAERLRSTEAKLATIVNNVNDIFYAVNFEGYTLRGKVELISSQVESVTGHPAQDFMENADLWFRLLHPGDIQPVKETTRMLLREKRPVTRVYRLRHKETHEYRWFEDRSSPQIDPDGKVIGLIGVARDISPLKCVEEALQVKTEQLQSVVNALTTLLDTGDWRDASRHILKDALRQSQSTFGFAGAVVEGPVLRILAHEGFVWDLDTNREFYERAQESYRDLGYLEFRDFNNLFGTVITTGKSVLSNDCEKDPRSGGLPAGHPPLKSFLGFPILNGDVVVGLIGVANRPGGYTEAEQEKLEVLSRTAGVLFEHYRRLEHETLLEEQLRQAQRMESIGRLAGGIAHDFNNLLTVILGHSKLLMEEFPPEGSERQGLEQIKKAADRAASLTRQLLAFSRKQMLQPRVLDLNTVVSSVEGMLGRLIGEDVQLKTVLDPKLEPVKADPGQIEQVIFNLAVNARDAMPRGGILTIETANVVLDDAYSRKHPAVSPGWHVMLAVSDTGSGMDQETLSHIFEPFFTTKEIGKGTGLGLATIYGIVKQSGGSIWVYSDVGRGTTFKVYFPRVEGLVAEPESIGTASSLSGSETILLVEDDEMVREFTRDILRKNGYTVLEARDGYEALRISRLYDQPIHLMLTDVVMPQMSGRQLAEQITPFHLNMKVLYMSGYTDNAVHHHGVLDPGIHFIEKPFVLETLLRKIRQVLDLESLAMAETTPTILVVDDEQEIRTLVSHMLRKAGYRVISASDGVEARRCLKLMRCDLVITDIIMPYKDGLDLSAEIRREFPNLKIIAVSAAGQAMSAEPVTHWFDAVLAKPFAKEELLSAVEAHLQK